MTEEPTLLLALEIANESAETSLKAIMLTQQMGAFWAVQYYIIAMGKDASKMGYMGQFSQTLKRHFSKDGVVKEPTKLLQLANKYITDYADEDDKEKIKQFLGKYYEWYFPPKHND